MPNSKVLQTLPQSTAGQGQYAILARLDGKAAFEFFTMPVEQPWERQAGYSPSGAAGVIVPRQNFTSVDGWSLSLTISMSTVAEKRSLLDYVAALAKFQVPDDGEFAPPVLAYRWGTRSFSPCIMTRFSKTEKGWFADGDLAACTVAFNLLEVPASQVIV